MWLSSRSMRGKQNHIKISEETQTCVLGAVAWITSRTCWLIPRALGVSQLTCGMKTAWELEVAWRCSCWLWVGFPSGPLLLQAASLTAKVALHRWYLPLMASLGSSCSVETESFQRLLLGPQCCDSPGAALKDTSLYSLSNFPKAS